MRARDDTEVAIVTLGALWQEAKMLLDAHRIDLERRARGRLEAEGLRVWRHWRPRWRQCGSRKAAWRAPRQLTAGRGGAGGTGR